MHAQLRGLATSGLLFGLLLVPSLAAADIPPPDDYVEKCTVEQAQARTGQECQICGKAYHGDREACANEFAGTPTMSMECQSYGASTWDEVWCDSAKALSPEQRQAAEATAAQQTATGAGDKGQKGCGCVVGEDEAPLGLAGGVLVVGLGLIGLGRRRRR